VTKERQKLKDFKANGVPKEIKVTLDHKVRKERREIQELKESKVTRETREIKAILGHLLHLRI
jgi:hypothetical protein